MLGQHVTLVTLYHGSQLILSKAVRIGDTSIIVSVVLQKMCNGENVWSSGPKDVHVNSTSLHILFLMLSQMGTCFELKLSIHHATM
jgi:hypothetical protein